MMVHVKAYLETAVQKKKEIRCQSWMGFRILQLARVALYWWLAIAYGGGGVRMG